MDVPRERIECDASCCVNMNPTQQCKDCRAVYYCSEVCQRQDAGSHQSLCLALNRKANGKIDPSPPEERRGASVSSPSTILVSLTTSERTFEETIAEVCSICLEDPNEKSCPVLTVDTCKDVFCLTCLVHWQRHDANNGDPEHVATSMDMDTIPGIPSSQTRNEGNDVNLPAAQIQQLSCVKKKCLRCPCCRAETEDLEQRLLETAKDSCARAKQRGCPSLLKEQLLQEAFEATSTLLQVHDPDLHAYYVRADVQFALGRPQDAVVSIQQLMKIDKERHAAIQENPVLAWIEHARHSYCAGDYDHAENGLNAASELVARIGRPAQPPPALLGSKRTSMYQAAYIFLGEVHQQQGQWIEALHVYQKLLRAHPEILSASTEQPGPGNDVVVQIWKGLAACSYELDAYAASIDAAGRAIAIDRSTAGVHKYKALSLVKEAAESNTEELLEQAVLAMNQAVLYEAPWDSDNQAANLKLYRRLCLRMKSTTSPQMDLLSQVGA